MSVFSPRCTDKQKSYIYRIAYAPAVSGPDFMRRLSTLFGTMKALIKGTTFFFYWSSERVVRPECSTGVPSGCIMECPPGCPPE